MKEQTWSPETLHGEPIGKSKGKRLEKGRDYLGLPDKVHVAPVPNMTRQLRRQALRMIAKRRGA